MWQLKKAKIKYFGHWLTVRISIFNKAQTIIKNPYQRASVCWFRLRRLGDKLLHLTMWRQQNLHKTLRYEYVETET